MLNAYHLYVISRWLYLHHIPFLPKLVTLLIFLVYNSKIPYTAKIGKGTRFAYGGVGVVIASSVVVGENCVIGQQVTLGGGNTRYPGAAVLGNNVYVAKGAIVFGGFKVGDNATVGANAVVDKPVPENAIVAGVPARILRIKNQEEIQAK